MIQVLPRHHITPTLLVLGALLGPADQVHAQRRSPEDRYEDMKKTPWLAATLEWIVPTLGHDYAGDRDAGRPPLYLMTAGVTMFIGLPLAFDRGCSGPNPESSETTCDVVVVVSIVGALTILGSRIWASVSSWKLANSTNASYRRLLGLDNAGLALSVTPIGQVELGVSLRF